MSKKSTTAQNKLYAAIDDVMEHCGTALEYKIFIKSQEEFHQKNFGKVVNTMTYPVWDASVFIYDEDTWYDALNYLLYLEYDKEWVGEAYLEEIDHYRAAQAEGLHATFVLRFFKNSDETVSCEPAVITLDEEITEDYGERMQKVIHAPKIGSDWDRNLSKIAKKWKKK